MSYYNNNMGERLCANKELYVSTSNPKKQKMKDKQMQNKLRKAKLNRFQTSILLIFLALVLALAVVIIVKVKNAPKIALTDDTIFTTLDLDKYSSDIASMYNREGQMELFKNEMDRIQALVGEYIVEHMTISDKDLKNIIADINKELDKRTWNNIVSNKSTYYVGKYSVDEKGNVKFKFETKSIEPDWVLDESVSKYIILN